MVRDESCGGASGASLLWESFANRSDLRAYDGLSFGLARRRAFGGPNSPHLGRFRRVGPTSLAQLLADPEPRSELLRIRQLRAGVDSRRRGDTSGKGRDRSAQHADAKGLE